MAAIDEPTVKCIVQHDSHINHSEDGEKEEKTKVHKPEAHCEEHVVKEHDMPSVDSKDTGEEYPRLEVRKFERMPVLKKLEKTEYRAVANRTRSHYNVNPRYKDPKRGTHKRPVLIDISDDSDTEVDVPKSLTEHGSKDKSNCTTLSVYCGADKSGSKDKSNCITLSVYCGADKSGSKDKSNCTTLSVYCGADKSGCKDKSNCTTLSVYCGADKSGPDNENDGSNCTPSSIECSTDDSDYSYGRSRE